MDYVLTYRDYNDPGNHDAGTGPDVAYGFDESDDHDARAEVGQRF